MGLDLSHWKPIRHVGHEEADAYFSIDELSTLPGYIEQHRQFIVEKDLDEYGKVDVIYFKSEGSQRKGMAFSFYSNFSNDGIYCDLKSVKKAYSFLQADQSNKLSALQSNFQKNFIDNFIEGESIFHVSW